MIERPVPSFLYILFVLLLIAVGITACSGYLTQPSSQAGSAPPTIEVDAQTEVNQGQGTHSEDMATGSWIVEADGPSGTSDVGGLEEMIVTGHRNGHGHLPVPQSTLEREERLREARARLADRAKDQEAKNRALAQEKAQIKNMFSASPDEEIWIIAKSKSDTDLTRSKDDDAPGSGAMLARLTLVHPNAKPIEPLPMPLKHSEVKANIDGYISTVDVTQKFHNPFSQKIEAVYLFPLPEKSAINQFVMTIGERKIRGILREKQEAQRLYNEARAQGYRASLLVQHRPNIFEQRVANIEPGNQIDVNIRYFHTLSYQDGWYSFVFPTVVGPRFNPPSSQDPVQAWPASNHGSQPSQGTAVRYLRPDQRSGHDISISVDIDAGVALEEVISSHEVVVTPKNATASNVSLTQQNAIPNQDFVLNFRVAGEKIKSNLLTYKDPKTGAGYFTLMVYPPMALKDLQRQSMEMVFVVDCSGSMSGAPMKQAKAAILSALDHLNPSDTFQIIRFSDQASHFGPVPVEATEANLRKARRYVERLSANGGTMMIEGIRQSLDFPHDLNRYRLVTFMTDGYIGNDREIIGEVSKRIGASRIFSFGVGTSVNRFLLERMASEGRGAASFLSLDDSAQDLMDLYFERISHPAMTDLKIDWQSMNVSEVYPRKLPDLFVGRPVIITGKYTGEARSIGIRGRAGTSTIQFGLEDADTLDEQVTALPAVWARRKIADLGDRQNYDGDPELAHDIKHTALAYQLMSDYTSFVAVDSSVRTAGSQGTTVHQAVPVPKGVKYETTVAK